MKTTCIGYATLDKNAPHVEVLEKSLEVYGNKLPIIRSAPSLLRETYGRRHDMPNTADNYGDAYNAVAAQAWNLGYDRIIICNDDIVLRPDTIDILFADADALDMEGGKWGYIGCRSDMVLRNRQWIGKNQGHTIVESEMVAPLCALFQRETWIPYPPVNTYSDNVQCWDMRAAGCKLYISRAYVHHVGGITVANPERAQADIEIAKAKLTQIRPDFCEYFFGANS